MKTLLLSMLVLAALVPGCADKPATAIVVAIQPEMPAPNEIDGIEIEVQRGSNFPFFQPYELDPNTRLPGTLTLTDDEGEPNKPLTISIRARRQGKEVILRRATLGFSKEKTKLLRMPLRYGCWGFPDSCPSGQSCKAGSCADDAVDPEMLPVFETTQVFGSISTGCFDASATGCFTAPNDVPVTSLTSCSIPVPGALDKFNLALHWSRAVDAAAITVVDEDADEGWLREAGGVRLSKGLCDAVTRGDVTRVVWSRACAPKQPLQPACDAPRPPGSGLGGAGGAGGAAVIVDAGVPPPDSGASPAGGSTGTGPTPPPDGGL